MMIHSFPAKVLPSRILRVKIMAKEGNMLVRNVNIVKLDEVISSIFP